MTTRRIISDEKTFLDKDNNDDHGRGASPQEPSATAPAVPMSVIWKLMSFTFAMITLPIGTYFFTAAYVFKGTLSFLLILTLTHPSAQINGGGGAVAGEEQYTRIQVLMMSGACTGNATYAGGLAALMANVVLMAYVVMAFKDDQEELRRDAEDARKKM
ncbi:hypothetical protein J1614_002547 [Plenodomus biglobosus]|nr:hypothetical protein J1614_002547 [Plenodomus biglobosus]